ncbi:NAD(P)-dependent oxidoreductase [Streptomyces sp. SL13]|uniref:NAD(P)-dependent oxidoreductase n=1 Tax=Streptantibioticus silvisoli TaxID=2705255 RepID=A0AA90K796_9ACTN|nr:NAD(P)-dependent oxidoreductase [Streptantibioticus silvisoli]MDI5968698.1 NAD(P)-dependent oxidoreductase [Streptantibioticus silvisoli]
MAVVDGHRLAVATDEAPGRVIVMGGTGFLGRHAVAAFAAAGVDVLAVSRQATLATAGCRSCHLDMLDGSPAELARIIDAERPVAVVNAAGVAWSPSPEHMEQGNHQLVEWLLSALDHAAWKPRLVHLGSMHEYAPQPVGSSLDEWGSVRPTTQYGRTKLLGTRAVLEAAAAGRTDAVVLRLSNVIGAGSPPNSLLGRVAQQLKEASRTSGPAVIRVAPLRAHRDFVDVRDTSEAIMCAATAPIGARRVFNIGRGEAVHVRSLVDQLIAASGIAAEVVEEDAGGSTRPPTDPDWMRVDIRLARRLLGWSPWRGPDVSVQELWKATMSE